MATQPQQNSTARQKVLEKILNEEVVMRPKFFFFLKAFALAAVALITLALSVSIGSFILFSIRASSETPLLGFGPPGYLIFLQLFPWPLLVLDIACVALLEWMLRKFRFGYKSPLLYLLFGIVVIVLAATVAVDRTHFSDEMLGGAHAHNIPGIGGLYQDGRQPPPPDSGACPCEVVAVANDSITMEEPLPNGSRREISVELPPGVATSTVHVGENVFIIGSYQNGVLTAFELHATQAPPAPPPIQ